jgi:hypothetical protein
MREGNIILVYFYMGESTILLLIYTVGDVWYCKFA